MPQLMNMSEYARHRGVSPRAVRKALQLGRIDRVPGSGRRCIDPESADRQWDERTGPRRDDPEPIRQLSYMEAKARRETALAQMAEIDLAKARGETADARKIRAVAMTVGRMTRDALLGLPYKLAPELVGLDDASEIEGSLTRALRSALDDLSSMAANDISRAMEW